MTINQVLQLTYPKLRKMIPNDDVIVYDGLTFDDICNDAMITVIKHFRDKEISEEEGFEYAKKTLLMEITFSHKRKGREKVLLLADVAADNSTLLRKKLKDEDNGYFSPQGSEDSGD